MVSTHMLAVWLLLLMSFTGREDRKKVSASVNITKLINVENLLVISKCHGNKTNCADLGDA